MKTKKIDKKLSLNKLTVSNLNSGDMSGLYGGANAVGPDYSNDAAAICLSKEDSCDICTSFETKILFPSACILCPSGMICPITPETAETCPVPNALGPAK